LERRLCGPLSGRAGEEEKILPGIEPWSSSQ